MTDQEELAALLRYSWTGETKIDVFSTMITEIAVNDGLDKIFADVTISERVVAYALNIYYRSGTTVMSERLKLHFAIFKYASERNLKKFYMFAAKHFSELDNIE